jgi:hypothetical protein
VVLTDVNKRRSKGKGREFWKNKKIPDPENLTNYISFFGNCPFLLSADKIYDNSFLPLPSEVFSMGGDEA